jgi:peptide-methionine (R)-S-oxide reductase
MTDPARRRLLVALPLLAAGWACAPGADGAARNRPPAADDPFADSPWRRLTEAQWRERLTPEQFSVLRQHATERAFTSPLDRETRAGVYACAGCGLHLFESRTKFDSGTGWPSFFDHIPGTLGRSIDTSFFMTRTEYHCLRCLGHHGHVFPDGPRPTGLRYCNNGDALTFLPGQLPEPASATGVPAPV